MKIIRIISALIFLFLSAFFEFALIGYRMVALALLGIAVLIILFGFVKIKKLLWTVVIIGIIAIIAIEYPIVKAAYSGNPEACDYVIVMGAGLRGDTPSLSLYNRLSRALSYLNMYPNSVAVVSGGMGKEETITEAEAMEKWLLENGISSERILKEDKATSSIENIEFSLELLAAKDGIVPQKIAIVSSEYHMFRCNLIAKGFGVEPVAVPATTTLPILKINYFLREGAALVYTKCEEFINNNLKK